MQGVPEPEFRLEEATIDELHQAINVGRTTCVAVVQHYLDRVRAYNGVREHAGDEGRRPVPEATGTVRAEGAAALSDPNREGL